MMVNERDLPQPVSNNLHKSTVQQVPLQQATTGDQQTAPEREHNRRRNRRRKRLPSRMASGRALP